MLAVARISVLSFYCTLHYTHKFRCAVAAALRCYTDAGWQLRFTTICCLRRCRVC